MKSLLPLLLFILATLSNAAVVQNLNRANLGVGQVRPGDRNLQRFTAYQPARPNVIQYQDYTYRGNSTNRVSAVFATEVGPTQFARAWILRGGIGQNNVTVRVQSARGYGYYYTIDIWGR